MQALQENLTRYLDVFDRAEGFSGPSIHFHHRAISRLRGLGRPSLAAEDELFIDYLYATLTAWGLHRMGPRGPKLVPFDTFAQNLKKVGPDLDGFCSLRIEECQARGLGPLVDALWGLIRRLALSATKSQVVTGTKALHHLLPDLVPPIDRRYTAEFFGWGAQMQGREQEMFAEVFPMLVGLAPAAKAVADAYLGRGWHTSVPKLVDNAVIGFVMEMKRGTQ
jgi:hypothetical protein